NKIAQGHSMFCGPAAFLRGVCTDDPVLYVWMAMQLFELGKTHMSRGQGWNGSKLLEANADLRSHEPPREINPPYWILLATITQAYTLQGGIPTVYGDGAAGPHQLVQFFKDTGYTTVLNCCYTRADAKSGSFPGESHDWLNARTASMLWDGGYKVVLLICQ